MAIEKGLGLTLGKMSEESQDGLTAGGDWIPAVDFRGHGKVIGFSSQISFQSAGDTDFYGEKYGDLQYQVGGFFRLGAALAKNKIYPHIKAGFVIYSFRQWQLETLADLDLEHGIAPAYGAGFDYWISDRLGLAIDYTIMELDYGKIAQKHDLISLGLFWRIGRN
jgi:hypothetical protein